VLVGSNLTPKAL